MATQVVVAAPRGKAKKKNQQKMQDKDLFLKTPAPDGKVYFSYAEVHTTVTSLVPRLQQEFQPTVMLAIGGGGFIPARILRTSLKIPMLAVSLELYDDNTKTASDSGVRCWQWFDPTQYPGSLAYNGNVLIVDEVDDTRATLQYCVEQVFKTCQPAAVGVVVVHNKMKPKRGVLPPHVAYYAGQDVPDCWNCYPWDAAAYGLGIDEHEELSRACTALTVSD